MQKLHHPAKPKARQLAAMYKAKNRVSAPPKHKTYQTETESPIHAVAEFAPMGGVLISYPGTIAPPVNQKQLPPSGPRSFGIPNELIVRMQQAETDKPVHIFILCDDQSQLALINKSLEATAIELGLAFDPALVHLVPWDTDTFWTRDYGPWWVKHNKSNYYGIAKHIYTSLGGGSVGMVEGAEHVDPREGSGIFRPNDDAGATKFSDFLNAPIRKWNEAKWGNGKRDDKKMYKKLLHIKPHNWYFTGLMDVGGNYMTNGEGEIASSYLVATQNELPVHSEVELEHPNQETIEHRMEYIMEQCNRFLGAKEYTVLTDPTGTYIGHIDCWGKFLAPNKILIAQSQDPEINAAFEGISDYFKNERGYEVYRVMCQDVYIPTAGDPTTTAAYTNSLILNNYVYVPLAGDAYSSFDEAALQVYRDALPDHNVIGIKGKPEFPWLGTDAMHCRTRGVPRDVVDNWLLSQSQPVVE